jgi:D-ribulokinase
MSTTSPVFLGIDVGTSGVRALATSDRGEVLALESVDFALRYEPNSSGHHEQDPDVWWQSVCRATGRLVEQLKGLGLAPDSLRGAAIDGTSGTLVALNAAGAPIRPALMYNDSRGAEQAERLNAIAEAFLARHGYSFRSSFAAAKIVWFQENEPHAFDRTACFAHQADYIVARLTGEAIVSDFNNALKAGYDLLEDRWPDWLASDLGIGNRLPRVVAPGCPVGQVSAIAAEQSGLPVGLPILAGTTDGVAACLASGLRNPGDYNTTLGTTLVFKGLSDRICSSPGGLVYSHKLPGGRWLPGAASNTGAEWIGRWFAGADLASMDQQAVDLIPTVPIAYPLTRQGERFPFSQSWAKGFFVREPPSNLGRYASCLLGTALVERLAYEALDRVTGHSGGAVYATGGGSRSDVWTQCRADVAGRVIHRPAVAESVFGAALLAASGVLEEPLDLVIERMVCIEKSFFPNVGRAALYEERFEEFGKELRSRGYL